jgi:hypothetical protein
MRATTVTLSLVSLLLTGVFSFSLAQEAAPNLPAPAQPVPTPPVSTPPAPAQPVPWHPCAKIRAACSQAGFVPNGAKMGVGIWVDCIRPIMLGMPQRNRAAKPLPPLDPQLVQACKQQNPNFGMGGGPARAQ